MNRIFYIMGKSATGKDKLYRSLLADPDLDLAPIVIYTTRPQRDGEVDGETYHFTDDAHLQAYLQAGRVIEQRTYQTVAGPWHYFTLDDGQAVSGGAGHLTIGTLESYLKMRDYYRTDSRMQIIPVYIEVEDGLRLERALHRERKESQPHYEEMCRRFLADQEDFSEAKLREAGIERRFGNNDTFGACLGEVTEFIRRSMQ